MGDLASGQVKATLRGKIRSMVPHADVSAGSMVVKVKLDVSGSIAHEGSALKRDVHAQVELDLKLVDAEKLRFGQELTFVLSDEDT